MPNSFNEYGRYYLTFEVDASNYVDVLTYCRNSLSKLSKKYEGVTVKPEAFAKIFDKWIRDFSVNGGFLSNRLVNAGMLEQRRAAQVFESTSKGVSEANGIADFINDSNFFAVKVGTKRMALIVGNLDVLDKRTLDWKEKYAGVSADEWYPNPPDYLNSSIGYWVWQEMGSGPPQHWLKSTVERYPDKYREIGGNVEARHFFLRGAQELHSAQKTIFKQVMTELQSYKPMPGK